MIVTNLTGWRHPAQERSGNHGSQYFDLSRARVLLDEPYMPGGWVISTDSPGDPWEVVIVEASPAVVRGGGLTWLLSWDGSQTNPRLVAYSLDDGDELGAEARLDPAPTVTLSITTQTGLHS